MDCGNGWDRGATWLTWVGGNPLNATVDENRRTDINFFNFHYCFCVFACGAYFWDSISIGYRILAGIIIWIVICIHVQISCSVLGSAIIGVGSLGADWWLSLR